MHGYVGLNGNDIFPFEKLLLIFTHKCYVQIKALFSTVPGKNTTFVEGVIMLTWHIPERLHHITR